jgi:hypothetical protein
MVSKLMPDFRPLDGRGSVGNNPSFAGTLLIPRKFLHHSPVFSDSETSASVHGACSRITSGIWRFLVAIRRQFPNLDPKSLFPVGIELIQGAIICGNMSTASLLVLEFQAAHGTFGAVQVRGLVSVPCNRK